MNLVQLSFINELFKEHGHESIDRIVNHIDEVANRAMDSQYYPESLQPVPSKEYFAANALVLLGCKKADTVDSIAIDLTNVQTLFKFGVAVMGSDPLAVALRRTLRPVLDENDTNFIINLVQFVKAQERAPASKCYSCKEPVPDNEIICDECMGYK